MEHIEFTLTGLFQWIFALLVALVIYFLHSTFKQNAEDKKSMMDRINKHSDTLNKLVLEHQMRVHKQLPCDNIEIGGEK